MWSFHPKLLVVRGLQKDEARSISYWDRDFRSSFGEHDSSCRCVFNPYTATVTPHPELPLQCFTEARLNHAGAPWHRGNATVGGMGRTGSGGIGRTGSGGIGHTGSGGGGLSNNYAGSAFGVGGSGGGTRSASLASMRAGSTSASRTQSLLQAEVHTVRDIRPSIVRATVS